MQVNIWRSGFLKFFGTAIVTLALFSASERTVLAMEDAILAVVDNEVITVKDLKEYMKGAYAQLRIEGRTPKEINELMAQYEYKGIEQLIEDRLITSAADKAGMMIRPKAIDDKIAEITKNYVSYDAFLAALNQEGLTVTDLRRKIENQIKGQGMVNNEVRAKVYVNPSEVTSYYTSHTADYASKARVFLSTIFVKYDLEKETAKKKMDEALAALKNGLDFKEAVTQYSELPSVGEIAADQLRTELKESIDHMRIGDVSDVIEVPNGYYIIKLDGRSMESVPTLMEVKDRIYKGLYEKKYNERFQTWIEDLRKKAYVEIKQ